MRRWYIFSDERAICIRKNMTIRYPRNHKGARVFSRMAVARWANRLATKWRVPAIIILRTIRVRTWGKERLPLIGGRPIPIAARYKWRGTIASRSVRWSVQADTSAAARKPVRCGGTKWL